MRVPNKVIMDKLGKIESKLDTIDKKVINEKLKEIHEDLIAHDKETCGQYTQAMGFTVMAISVAFLITAFQPNPDRYLISGFILFLIAMLLITFYARIGDFSYNLDRKRREKKAKKDKKEGEVMKL